MCYLLYDGGPAVCGAVMLGRLTTIAVPPSHPVVLSCYFVMELQVPAMQFLDGCGTVFTALIAGVSISRESI
jgi:hypothetical protein